MRNSAAYVDRINNKTIIILAFVIHVHNSMSSKKALKDIKLEWKNRQTLKARRSSSGVLAPRYFGGALIDELFLPDPLISLTSLSKLRERMNHRGVRATANNELSKQNWNTGKKRWPHGAAAVLPALPEIGTIVLPENYTSTAVYTPAWRGS